MSTIHGSNLCLIHYLIKGCPIEGSTGFLADFNIPFSQTDLSRPLPLPLPLLGAAELLPCNLTRSSISSSDSRNMLILSFLCFLSAGIVNVA